MARRIRSSPTVDRRSATRRAWSPSSITLLVATGLAASGVALGAAGPAVASAGVLYVDANSLTCSASGGGSAGTPYCTITSAAKVAQPGQTVLVSAGTYPEQVTPARSGSPGLPIAFIAAAGEPVVVTGAATGYGFKLSSRSWITITGFTIVGTPSHGISATSGAHLTVSGNDVSGAGEEASGYTKRGIYLSGITDSVVSDNVTHDNSEAGIYLDASSARITVSGNRSFRNARGYTRAAPGIDVRGVDNIVTRNVTYDNEDTGLQFYNGAARNVVSGNVTYGNGDHGIDDLGAVDQVITGNTVYDNVAAGINLEGGSTGGQVFNNISVDNGVGSPRTKSDIRVDPTSTTGATVDWNVVSVPASYVLYIWGKTNYTSLASFRAATGQEAHGIQADPLWADASAGDFHLLDGSPAVDSAWSSAPGALDTDVEGAARFDDPAVVDTGAGTRSYDDRGAYERQ
jgi:parallel beta-helix repeat protein